MQSKDQLHLLEGVRNRECGIAMPWNLSPRIAMHPNSALPNWDALLCTRAYRDSAQCTHPIVMNFRAADASRCVAHQLRGLAIGRRYQNSHDLVEDFCIFADGQVGKKSEVMFDLYRNR